MKQRHIYFIRPVGQKGPVKIGCSESPDERLHALMTGSPTILEIVATVPGDRALEQGIHHAFASSRSHGEWFHPSVRMSELIRQITLGGDIGAFVNCRSQDNPIKTARLRLRETQIAFADRLGIDQSTIHRWESKGIPRRGPARIAVQQILAELNEAAA